MDIYRRRINFYEQRTEKRQEGACVQCSSFTHASALNALRDYQIRAQQYNSKAFQRF